jgi:MYXO-CTERM domain-containing protein
MRRVLVTVVCALCLSCMAFVDVSRAAAIYDPYSNTNLYVVAQGSWTTAETEAQALGGHLVTIHDAAENAFIVSNVLKDLTGEGGPNLSAVPVWIGLYDPTGATNSDGDGMQHAANFQWVDGSISGYRNWNSGEPNNANFGEYYAAINWHFAQSQDSQLLGTWNDAPQGGSTGYGGNTNGPYYGLASVPVPEPSTLLVWSGLGAVGLGTAWRRRRRAA